MSEYIFEKNEGGEELRRLRRIEAALDTHSRALIERTGLAAGWRCLEVGAGGGSILRWLGERVGVRGQAVGIDKNVSHLAAFTEAPFEIIEGDVLELERPSCFDLIHARYVLIHNREREGIVQRLRKLLKPGGYLVLEEPDFESAEWLDAESREAGQRVNRAICALFRGLSLDPGFGKHLPLLLTDAGLAIRCLEDRGHLEPGGGPVAMVMADSAGALREKYAATGEASLEDVDRYARAARDPKSWALYYSTIGVVALKR